MKISKLVFLVASIAFTPLASAGIINDVSNNSSEAAALNLNSGFTTGEQTGVIGSNEGWSWVSVSAVTDGTFDFFSFTNSADNSNWWFDVDAGVDSEIALWTSGGDLVWQDTDDGCEDMQASAVGCGSLWANDDSGLYEERGVTLSAGDYIFAIGAFPSSYSNGFGVSGSSNDSFTFHISTDNEVSAVSEPSVLAMFSLAMAGLLRRRALKK